MKTDVTNMWPSVALIVFSVMLVIACNSGGGDGVPANDDQPGVEPFIVSGTITPAGISAVDNDVNDPNAPFLANDTFDQAQQLYFPVILAGYVNLAGRGETGRSFAIGDPHDFYRITLSAGDSIVLYIARPNDTDMDLYLYRADDFTLVDASTGTGANVTLSAPNDGEFIVDVGIFSEAPTATGASSYNLIIGTAADLSDLTSYRLSHEFIAGEIVVRFTDDEVISSRALFSDDKTRGGGMDRVGGETSREMLLSFGTGEQTRSVFEALDLKPPSMVRALSTSISEAIQHKIDTLKVIKALNRRFDIKKAAPNFIRQPFIEPNDKFFGLQWHYNLIHLPEAWEMITGNDEVVVAVVDTGVLTKHPDLGARLTSDGYDFISDAGIEGNEPQEERGGIDPNPDDPGDQSAGGSSFHGTHVAGTIAADTDNAIGVAGVGWDAVRIMPLRSLGVGGGTSYDIIQAVRYAAGLPNDSGTIPANPADIINLSLGGGGHSTVEQDLYQTISQSGVIVVAAAGNEANNQKSYPAAYDGVISVSAVDYSSNLAYYSNFGDTIDIAAPGGDTSADLNADGYPDGVLSTTGDDISGTVEMGYRFSQGTSMAAPHVAGVSALMKAIWPEMAYSQFDYLLRNGLITKDLGTPGKDEAFGYGLIDAQKAILAARGGTIPTSLSVSPSAISFGTVLSTATLRLAKSGVVDAALSVRSTSDDSDWLTVFPDRVDGDGLGTYTVEVDRTGLADGIYRGNIKFVSSSNTVDVPISLLVSRNDRAGNAGYHYVLLLDPPTFNVKAQVEATFDAGVYHFSFSDVPDGEYLLYAGSDLDNDFVVGDLGNALGAYLSIDQPIVLGVDQDVVGLDFRTEFKINLFDSESFNHVSEYLPIQRNQKKRLKE